MKKMIRNIVEKILHLSMVYTIGIFLGFLFYALQAIKTVRVLHKERIPHNHENQGLLVISNHPSLLEPILIPLLFFWDYILHPFKLCPISIPDKVNYLDKWYWWWLRFCSIPIDRRDKKQRIGAFFKMRDVLNSKGILILFPEGGRTETAPARGQSFLCSQGGNKIATLDGGLGLLISRTNPLVLLVWIKGAEKVLPNSPDRTKLYWTFPRLRKQMTIKIGNSVCFRKGLDSEEIVQKVAAMLLESADEKNQKK